MVSMSLLTLASPRLDRALANMPTTVTHPAYTIKLCDSTANAEIYRPIAINIDRQRPEFACECD